MKVADSGLFYNIRVTQNQQKGTSKDMMKDFKLEEKFCYLKDAKNIYKISYPWGLSWIFPNHITRHAQ